MKRTQLLILLFIFLVPAVLAQSGMKPRYIKPVRYNAKTKIRISEKVRTYYELSPDKATMVAHSGPGIIRVVTRGTVPEQSEKISYTIRYVVDGGEEQHFMAEDVGRYINAAYPNGKTGVPGHLEDFSIELGPGEHSIELFLDSDDVDVAARFKFIPIKEKKVKWISFCPEQPSEPVDLVSGETIYNYYRFSESAPLKIKIIGPTTLRIFTRVENRYDMRGRVHYRLQINENGRVINTYQVSSTPSEVTHYKDEKSLVPGKAQIIFIDVPEGEHNYEIVPLDKDKNHVLGRVLIPRKDVRLVK